MTTECAKGVIKPSTKNEGSASIHVQRQHITPRSAQVLPRHALTTDSSLAFAETK